MEFTKLNTADYHLELKSIKGPHLTFMEADDDDEKVKGLVTSDFIDARGHPLTVTITGVLSSRGITPSQKTAFGMSVPKLGIVLSQESRDKLESLALKLEHVKGIDETWTSYKPLFQKKWYTKNFINT